MAGNINITGSSCYSIEGNIVAGEIIIDGVPTNIEGNVILKKHEKEQDEKSKYTLDAGD